jgi:pyruvate dehydrogenase (quinone)
MTSGTLAHSGPAVLDVMTSPQELAIPSKIELEQVYGSVCLCLKLCLGRGSEVVELAKTNLFQ